MRVRVEVNVLQLRLVSKRDLQLIMAITDQNPQRELLGIKDAYYGIVGGFSPPRKWLRSPEKLRFCQFIIITILVYYIVDKALQSTIQ